LAFLQNYLDEDAYLPLISIADNLFKAYLVFDGQRQEAIRSFGRSMLENTLSAIGYFPVPDENLTNSLLRDQILWPAVVYGSNSGRDNPSGHFKERAHGRRVDGGDGYPGMAHPTFRILRK